MKKLKQIPEHLRDEVQKACRHLGIDTVSNIEVHLPENKDRGFIHVSQHQGDRHMHVYAYYDGRIMIEAKYPPRVFPWDNQS